MKKQNEKKKLMIGWESWLRVLNVLPGISIKVFSALGQPDAISKKAGHTRDETEK